MAVHCSACHVTLQCETREKIVVRRYCCQLLSAFVFFTRGQRYRTSWLNPFQDPIIQRVVACSTASNVVESSQLNVSTVVQAKTKI